MEEKKYCETVVKNYTPPKADLVPLKTEERLFGSPINGDDNSSSPFLP